MGIPTANVIQFPHPIAPVQSVAHFIRLGESGYIKLANLHAAGWFPATRVVFDASRLRHQKELVSSLRAKGAEADRQAKQVKDLKFSAEQAIELKVDIGKLSKRLVAHCKQVEKMRRSLEDLHETRADGAPRARPIVGRITRDGQGKAGSK
jgi:hypothetical protein